MVGECLENVDLVAEQCVMDLSFDVLHVDQLEPDAFACRIVMSPVDDVRVALS